MSLRHFLSVGAAAAVVALASQAHAGVNLVQNGDFSLGNTDFGSGYVYVPQPGSPATGPATSPPYNSYNESTYGVGTNADLYHNLWYNVTAPGGGNYLVVNGNNDGSSSALPTATLPLTVWDQSVTVTANTTYDFSAQATGIYPSSPATLEFLINGTQVGSTLTLNGAVPDWITFSSNWSSGAGGSVTLSIIDTNTVASGNDFGVDHISLAAVPELSTWGMMGLGFAGLAFAGYRSRKAVSVAF